MQTINGFQLEKDFSAENAGFCRWAFAKKGSYDYFIKEFLSPKYPEDGCGLSEAVIERKRAECATFFREKTALYNAVKKCRTGNIVINHAFFRSGSKFYAVMERMYPYSMTPAQVSTLSEAKKGVLIRSLLYSFAALHRQGIVHADVKPDNILIKKTKNGFFTGKIIDFDSGFFESSPPDPEELQGDQVYLAPEARLYMMEQVSTLSTKVDIFALGLLFHQYWCGRLPSIPGGYDYTFEAVLDGVDVMPDARLPEPLRGQIRLMLSRDPRARPSAAQVLEQLMPAASAGTGGREVPPMPAGFHPMGRL